MIALPDVNVLVALIWEGHVHHGRARAWFAGLGDRSFGTCAVTQLGFVRVSSNPAVLAAAISVAEAIAVLGALVAHPAHRYLADASGFAGNHHIPHGRLVGHRQVTDGYLVGLARQHEAQVVSFDRGLGALADDVDVLTPGATPG